MIKKKILSTFLALCMLLTLAQTMSIPVYAVLGITNIDNKTLTPLVVGYAAGDKETTTYTLENLGDVAFTSLELVTDGANPTSFSVTLQPTGILAPGETTSFTVVAVDGLAAGSYSVNVHVRVNGSMATWCTITQEVSASKGTQVAPNHISTNHSHYNANDGRLFGLTTAMEYKLSTDPDYNPCTGTEVTGLVPAIYKVRYKETAVLNASDAIDVTIHEIAGGLTATLAPLSPAQDNKMRLTITEDARVLDGAIYYMITNSAESGEIKIGDDGEFLTSEFNSMFYEYTVPVEIAIQDGYYVVAFKIETTITGENTAAIFNKMGVSSAANDAFTPVAPSGLDAVNMPYGATNSGKIVGTTTAMEYKLSSEDDTAYQDCANTETTGLAAGNYVIRFKATSDTIASPTVTKTVKQIAGGITAALAPLSTPKENKVMLTISEDIRESLGTIMYIIVEDSYIDDLNMYVNDELDFGSVDSDIQLLRYTNPVEIDITKGHKVLALKGDVRISGTNTVIVKSYKAGISSEPNDGYTAPTGGGGGGGSTPSIPQQPGNTIVTVNGVSENAGTETKTTENGKLTTLVQVDNTIIKHKIDEAIKNNTTGAGNVIQVPVADTKSDTAKVELTGDIVKKLEESAFDVSVKRDTVEYIIPAEEFTISRVAENLGLKEKDLADIKVEVKITRLDEKAVERYNEAAKVNGAVLVFPPVSFEVMAKTTKTDGSTEEVKINTFSKYVERVLEIPAGVGPSSITTGIVFNPDGTYSHVPTEVFQKDGKWYARINSLTNSNYSVIKNKLTVKSVENHWSKAVVNDLASRLVIFNSEVFAPDQAITRADFAEYIVRALGLYREGSSYKNGFTDVNHEGARTRAILIANANGIVSGYPDGTFRPDGLITREEAMAIYQRTMKMTKLVGTAPNRYQTFTDYDQVGTWATNSVKEALSAHIVNGTTATTISPKSNLTYAEAVQVIKNLLVQSKLINK